jgi:DNA-binding CsgD family transcriptional regulator
MLFDKFNMDIKDNFEIKFAKAYPKFTKNLVLKIDDITPQEVKICMCLKMSFSNENIREFLKISERTLANARSCLRKKLGLKRSESLTNAILCI